MTRPLLVDRRFIISSGAALGASLAVAPQTAVAAKGDAPTGQAAALELDAARAVDVAALEPGEMAVVSSDGTYYGIVRRTAEQIAAAEASEGGSDPASDGERVQNPEYLVVDMVCPHRNCQVGYTGETQTAFVCPCHRSSFDASGRVTKRPARANLSIPDYEISETVVTFL